MCVNITLNYQSTVTYLYILVLYTYCQTLYNTQYQ